MQDLNEYESVSGAAELAGVSDESLDLLSDNQRPSDTANQRDLSSNDKENKEPDESKKDIQSQSDNGTEESSPGQEELARKEDSAAGTPGRIQLPTESPHQVDSEHLVQIATDAGKARAISTRKWRFLLSKMGLAVYGSRDVLVRRFVLKGLLPRYQSGPLALKHLGSHLRIDEAEYQRYTASLSGSKLKSSSTHKNTGSGGRHARGTSEASPDLSNLREATVTRSENSKANEGMLPAKGGSSDKSLSGRPETTSKPPEREEEDIDVNASDVPINGRLRRLRWPHSQNIFLLSRVKSMWSRISKQGPIAAEAWQEIAHSMKTDERRGYLPEELQEKFLDDSTALFSGWHEPSASKCREQWKNIKRKCEEKRTQPSGSAFNGLHKYDSYVQEIVGSFAHIEPLHPTFETADGIPPARAGTVPAESLPTQEAATRRGTTPGPLVLQPAVTVTDGGASSTKFVETPPPAQPPTLEYTTPRKTGEVSVRMRDLSPPSASAGENSANTPIQDAKRQRISRTPDEYGGLAARLQSNIINLTEETGASVASNLTGGSLASIASVQSKGHTASSLTLRHEGGQFNPVGFGPSPIISGLEDMGKIFAQNSSTLNSVAASLQAAAIAMQQLVAAVHPGAKVMQRQKGGGQSESGGSTSE